MLQSKLFAKTRKEAPADEDSKNAKFLIQGGFIDKLQSGVYTYLPLGFRVLKKIENIIKKHPLVNEAVIILLKSDIYSFVISPNKEKHIILIEKEIKKYILKIF